MCVSGLARRRWPVFPLLGGSRVSARRKGHDAERELVRYLREPGFDVRRNLDQARDGGSDVLGFHHFAVEVKRCERLRVWEAIDQAAAATQPGQVPLVCFRRSRGDWQALLPLQELLSLIESNAGVTP
jgi:Holliday junction resolvase